VAEVTGLAYASTLLCTALAFIWAARDCWKRYLAAVDRTAGLKALEKALSDRLQKIEATQAAHQRAIGIRAIAQAKAQAESAA